MTPPAPDVAPPVPTQEPRRTPRPDVPPAPSATPPTTDVAPSAPTQEPRRRGDTSRPDAPRPDATPGQPPIPPSVRTPGTPPPAATDLPGAPPPDGRPGRDARPGRPGLDEQGRPDGRQGGRQDEQGRRDDRRRDREAGPLRVPGEEFREGEARRGGGEFRRFDPERRESQDYDRRDRRLDQEFGRREERQGNRLVIREGDDRTIIRENGRTIIRHDDTERLRRGRRDEDVRVDRRNGEIYTVIRRPNGIEIVSVTDENGRLIRRFRRERDREYMLIDNRRRPGFSLYLDLAPVRVHLPREEYIVDADQAGYEEFEAAFTAPPVEPIERAYSLDEVRQNVRLRDRVRSVDVNTINFEFGEFTVPQDQIAQLEGIARAIGTVIERNPQEVFLIEGHTDAVGTDVDNLSLSDRRAEEVAAILSETYQIPAENLVTQGYGEQYLRVDTEAANAENRRVTVRNITPLLNAEKQPQ